MGRAAGEVVRLDDGAVPGVPARKKIFCAGGGQIGRTPVPSPVNTGDFAFFEAYRRRTGAVPGVPAREGLRDVGT